MFISIIRGGKNDFFAKQANANYRKISIINKGVEQWNSLPQSIKECVTLCSFKRGIKLDMFDKY